MVKTESELSDLSSLHLGVEVVAVRDCQQINFVMISSILACKGGERVRESSANFLFSVKPVRESVVCENRRPLSLTRTMNRLFRAIFRDTLSGTLYVELPETK